MYLSNVNMRKKVAVISQGQAAELYNHENSFTIRKKLAPNK